MRTVTGDLKSFFAGFFDRFSVGVDVCELVWGYLVNHYYDRSDKRYFDFGISTEQDGSYLNNGLIAHKEGFDARAITYDTYKEDVAHSSPF